jgi:hypothetical protein
MSETARSGKSKRSKRWTAAEVREVVETGKERLLNEGPDSEGWCGGRGDV